MSDDVITRAKAALRNAMTWEGPCDYGTPVAFPERLVADLIALAESKAEELAEIRGLHYTLTRIIEEQAAKLAAIRAAITRSSGMSDMSVFIRILAILDGNQNDGA